MLVLSLLVTLTAFNFARQEAAQHLDIRFASATNELADDIRERMARIEESLHASRAFVLARKNISREEWRTFQNNQAIESYHPGTFGIGMAPEIRRQDADAFVRAMRRHDHVDYKIWPTGDRSVYAPIRFTASHNGDTRALGLDMYSEPRRRAAMERARDTGEASLSGVVTLVKAGDKESRESIILFLPVYSHTLAPDASVDQRRAAFVSYVYCPILIAEFWRDVVAKASQMNVAVQITDTDGSTILPLVSGTPVNDNALKLKSEKDVYGQRWDFEFRAMPGFADTGLSSRAAIVAAAGIAISLLLFGIVWVQASTKLRAEAIARNMTRALRDSEGRLRSMVEHSPDAMIMHQNGKIVFANAAMARLMHVADAAALIGQSALAIVHPQRRKIAEQRIQDLYVNKTLPLSEQTYIRADGTTVDVEVAAVSFELDTRAAALVTVRDISERKRHEAENERLRRLYAALSQINQAIVWMPTRDQLLQKICDVLVEHGGFRLAWIGWHAPQSGRLIPVAQSGDDGSYLEGVTIYADDRPEGNGPAGRAFREGKPYICRDFLADPLTLPWRAEAERRGFRAAAVFPIRLKGEVSGTLAVYATDTESFEDKEISLLAEAAIDVSFALDNFAREEENRHNEDTVKRLAAIVESTDDAIIAENLEGIITDWNPSAERLFGYKASEIIGRPMRGLVPPDRLGEEEQILARIVKGESIQHFETLRMRKDGQTFPVSVTISPIWRSDSATAGAPQIIGASKIVRDISERKRTEEGLQRFHMAMQTSQDGIFLMDFETFRYLDVNETGCRMLGYSREELLTMRTLDTNPGMTETEQRRRFDEAKALGSEHVLTEPEGRTMRHKNGSVFPIEVARRYMRIGEKEIVVGVARDISVLASTMLRAEKIAYDLTAELREREHRFRTLWETTNDAVVLLDDQGRIQYASPALRDVFGHDPGDVIGKNIEFLQPSHLRAGHRAGFARYLRTGNKTLNWRSVQTSGLHSKGHEVPVEIVFSQMDFDGRPGFAGFIRDITERKRAEEALRESEYKYRQIVEMSPDAVTIHEDGKWVFANPAAARLLGVEQPSQLIGRSLLDFMHPDIHEQIRQRWKRLYEDRQPVSPVELKIIKPDGSIAYLETSGAPVVWQGRRAAQAVARDITERKRAEEALRTYEDERRQLAQKVEWEHARLVEAQAVAKVGSWETELPSMKVTWSNETYRIFDRDQVRFPVTHSAFLEWVHSEDRAIVDAAFTDSLDQRLPRAITHRIVTPDGRVKIVEERWQVYHDDQGRPFRVTGTCQDITQRKETEQALREYTRRLQTMSRQLLEIQENERRLLARELHDTVGQELTALSLNLSMIRSAIPVDLGSKVDQHLDDSQQLLDDTTQHLRSVMGQLRPPGLDEFGVLTALKEHARRTAQRSGFELVVSGVEPQPRLPLETAIAVFRIAQEALHNAVKHAQATKVSIELQETSDVIRLTIADNGRGFDMTRKPLMVGTGMGMTTMRERAEAIGAQLLVQSEIDEGTRIIIEIRRTTSPAAPTRQES